jgi:2-keto-3-deoxy-L-rhamnonate aldolase RhmA
MGIPGKIDDQRVVSAIDSVVAACRKHNKWPGLGGVYSKELMKRYIERGMRMILSGNDLGLLMSAAQDQAGFVMACQPS